MKVVLLLLLLCACGLSLLALPDVDDASLSSLLAGDWQALLPEEMLAERAQLIKLLTPSAPSQPQHTLATHSHSHYRLARDVEF